MPRIAGHEAEGAGPAVARAAITVADDPVECGWLSATLAYIAPLAARRQSGLSASLVRKSLTPRVIVDRDPGGDFGIEAPPDRPGCLKKPCDTFLPARLTIQGDRA
jgi:hypothetical protein